MDAMEEFSVHSGKFCWRWRGSDSRQERERPKSCCAGNGQIEIPGRRKRSRSDRFGIGPVEGLREDQSPCGLGLGTLQFSLESFAGGMRVLRLFARVKNGVACFNVL